VTGEAEVPGQKPVAVSVCSLQIPNELAWYGTWPSTVSPETWHGL